jgi:hypothetical protein
MRVELPGSSGVFALVAVNGAHRLDRGGGQLRLKGTSLVAIGAGQYFIERVRGRLRRAFAGGPKAPQGGR